MITTINFDFETENTMVSIEFNKDNVDFAKQVDEELSLEDFLIELDSENIPHEEWERPKRKPTN